jgi:hypothetical protein
MSPKLTLTPLDHREREILDQLKAGATRRFGETLGPGRAATGSTPRGAPADGYEAALDRLAADWREHLSAAS